MLTAGEQIADLFYFLAEEELAHLLSYFSFRHLRGGERLWKEGELCESMVFVVSGRLEASKETEFRGKSVVVGVMNAGSMVGDACMIDRQPRDTSVKALEDTALLCLSREHFEKLLAEHPALGMKLLKSMLLSLSSRLRHSIARLAAIF